MPHSLRNSPYVPFRRPGKPFTKPPSKLSYYLNISSLFDVSIIILRIKT